MKKLIALLTAAVATLTSAWAATPVAVWDGDFTIATKNGYTIDKNGNTNNGKNITISGSTGMTVTGTGGQLVTVLVKAKYTPTQSSNTEVLAAILNGDKAHVGVGGRKDSTELWGVWDGNQWGSNKTDSNKRVEDTDSHKIAVTYTYTADLSQQNLQGTTIYYDGQKVKNWDGLRGGGVNIGSAAVIGGPKVTTGTNLKAASGMVIEGVAIFGADATQDDITGYTFPSETTMAAVDYSVFSENPAVLTWAGTSATFHSGPWNLFDIESGTDGDQVTGSTVPGQSGNVTIWNVFANNSKMKYVAPGYVLRLTKNAYCGSMDAQFTDLAFGGLIVEQGAQGCSFTSVKADNSRQTYLGDANGEKLNTLEIRESLVFNRSGVFKLYGTINANIAETKVLDLNYGQTTAANWPVLQSGATLKMLGKGNILVKTLDATAEGVTLDYSAQSVSRTMPYINGTVKIGANTNIVLPSDYVLGSAYQIASAIDSSTSVGTIYTKSVTIGETVHENVKLVVLTDGKIMVTDGEINPAAGVFCLYDWTFTGTLTSKGVYTNTLEWDTGFSASNGFLTDETFTYGTALNACATPYVPATAWSISYPTEWTCFVAGIAPSNVGGGLIVFGTTDGGAIGLVTTGSDKVALVRTTGNSKYESLEEMTVPGAQTTSHAYTFVKTASAITVYLDGNVITEKAVSNATFGNKLQVGSIHGGTKNTGIVKAESGSIQAVRIMNGVQPAATIRAFSNEFPYHSPNGTYARTFAAGEQNWSAEDAWTSTKDEGNVAEPGAGLVQANFSGETTVSVNLASDVTYESLTINNNESGSITFVAAEGSAGSIKAAQMTVNAPIVLGENAVDLSKGPLTLGAEGSITFDFSGLPYAGAVAAYPFVEKVTGVVTQNDEKFILKAPAENDDFSLAIRYNEGDKYYEVAATYKNLVDVTIPEVTGATASVSLGEKTVEIAEGKVTVPATANLTVTYTADTGYTMGATTVATLENAQEGSTVDVTGITATLNKYTVQVMHVENATTYVSIGGGEFEVVTEASIQVEHGKSYSAKYVANEGYMLVLPEGDTEPFKTEGYNYGSVTFNTADYPVHCAAVKIAAKIGDTPYATVQAAIEALVDGETTLADITVVDKTATLPEGYEDYTIDEDGKIVLAKSATELFLEGIAAGGEVALTGDVTLTSAAVIPTDKTVTLDLNGHTITAPGTAISVLGTLTINDTGTDGKIVSNGNCGIAVGDGATLTVNSGIIESVEGAIITGKSVGATITINGGTFSASDNAVIAGNGTKRDGDANKITINGGTFNGAIKSAGYIACGIYAPWKDQITVDGGTFNITGGCGVCARAGTVAIGSGVTINLINEGTVSGWVGDNKNAVPGVQAFFDYAAKYPGLAEGDAILSDVNTLTIADTQEWVGDTAPYTLADKQTSTDLPGAEEVPADQKDAYNEWAEKNGITAETTQADATTAATAFVMGVTVADGQTLAEAAEAKADTLLEEVATTDSDDFAAELQAGELSEETVAAFETAHPGLTIGLVEAEELTSTETSKFFKLSITIKK